MQLIAALLMLLAVLLGFNSQGVRAENGAAVARKNGVILVSDKIRPYLAALEGISEVFSKNGKIKTELFFLSDFTDTQLDSLHHTVQTSEYAFAIAIGPEAARFFAAGPPQSTRPPVIYTILLNPENIIGSNGCGVSLNIPVAVQLQTIAQMLPAARRIGILYNAGQNAAFVDQARQAAANMNRLIVPLQTSSTSQLADVLEKNWHEIDALWFIPDSTVISESIVKYVIKEAFIHHVPTIGYNRFFYESGAVLSFSFDYATLGRQTALLTLDYLAGAPCVWVNPAFNKLINQQVCDKLGIRISEHAAQDESAP